MVMNRQTGEYEAPEWLLQGDWYVRDGQGLIVLAPEGSPITLLGPNTPETAAFLDWWVLNPGLRHHQGALAQLGWTYVAPGYRAFSPDLGIWPS